MANRRLGKYEIIERLGRGGMAEVFRAYHASLDRYVAIKILHTSLASAPEFKERFEQEAQNIARLKHPHIIQVYDFDYDPGASSYYMVMELIEGLSLEERLSDLAAQGAKLPFGEVLRIVDEAASALAYAHGRNMIHRDVKPANLMLDHGRRVVLTDFGLARLLAGQPYTTLGGLVGTPAYMAPERGMSAPGDERSDLYSLGVIFFELLTGRLPYEADTPVAMILKHVNEPIPSACEVAPTLPREVDVILARLLAKQPGERYQRAIDLMDDLKRLKAGQIVDDTSAVRQTLPLDDAQPSIGSESLRGAEAQKSGLIFAPGRRDAGVTWWGWVASVTILVMLGTVGVLLGVYGNKPSVAVLPSETPTLIWTATLTDTPSITPTLSPTQRPTEMLAATMTPVVSLPGSATATVGVSTASSPVPTRTLAQARTDTPTPTPNATETLAYIRTATAAACKFDYEIVVQTPRDGLEGGFYVVNMPYERRITVENTGDCAWEQNTSLTFIDGEDFDAGPRIFIREAVEPGAQVTVVFRGTLPPRGSLTPVAGVWELRTPGQIRIGQPMIISIFVYEQ